MNGYYSGYGQFPWVVDTAFRAAMLAKVQEMASDELELPGTGTDPGDVPVLGSDGKLDTQVLPEGILGAMKFKGFWNASTNSPALPTAGAANLGWFYVVNVAGSTSIGGVTDWKVGDWVVSLGADGWGKIDSTDQVTAVAGLAGNISASALAAALLSQFAAGGASEIKPVEAVIIAVSDEATALTAGTAKVTFRMPFAMTLTGIRASLTTAQASGSVLTVDVNEGGSSILSTKLTFDNTEKTTTTATTAPVLSDTSLTDDAEITVDIDQIGASGAKGLKVTLIGRRT